ncbi:MAG: monovalent cation/H(+) antiporter subunit G [Steroidobacteraceae bacterium]
MTGIGSPWVAVPVALLLLAGGLLTLVGSLGLVRLRDFQARMHGASMGSTLGLGCIIVASVVASTAVAGRFSPHALLVTVFVVMTAPATAMLLMRASLYRARAKSAAAAHDVIER